jgi:hypothetical protein
MPACPGCFLVSRRSTHTARRRTRLDDLHTRPRAAIPAQAAQPPTAPAWDYQSGVASGRGGRGLRGTRRARGTRGPGRARAGRPRRAGRTRSGRRPGRARRSRRRAVRLGRRPPGTPLRRATRRGRGRTRRAPPTVGAVKTRALEDDADRGIDLAQLALAGGADGQGVVGELLDRLERLAALGALVLVRRHVHAPDWHSDSSSANSATSPPDLSTPRSRMTEAFNLPGKTCTLQQLHAYWIQGAPKAPN